MTKEFVDPKDPLLKKMVEKGLPVWKAEFQSSVNNTDDVPEYFFSNHSNHPSRNVQMWWLPGDGLLCLHKHEYFFVPSTNIKYVKIDVI